MLLAHIRSASARSHETYGSPRVTRELQEKGLTTGRRRIARLKHQVQPFEQRPSAAPRRHPRQPQQRAHASSSSACISASDSPK